MCGLVGIASSTPVASRTGRDVMTHRGPDDAGGMANAYLPWCYLNCGGVKMGVLL